MADNLLSSFLPDDRASFGVFPQMQPRRRFQDREASANVPLDVTRGRVAGLAGLLPDTLNFMGRSPMPTEMFGDTQYEPTPQLPYGSEYYLQNLPLKPTSRIGEVAGQAGAFVPLNPMSAARAVAAGVKALGPTAVRMAEGYLTRTGGILPLDVYHGSPYKFDRFDASKISTGEGAQAYGHGIYTAENPGTAQGYQATLGHKGALDLEQEAIQRGIPLSREAKVELMRQSMRDVSPKMAVKNLQNASIDARNLDPDKLAALVKDYMESKQGSFYKVDLPDKKIARMLDWDKPLSEQPDFVKNTLINDLNIDDNWATISGDSSGGALYNSMVKEYGSPEAVSAALMNQGIPGIKYLDATSRGGGQGTRNFVTFPGEEQNLTILERNGQPLALKAEETFAGFATPEQYNAAKFYGQNQTERWPAAWAKSGTVTPEEILRQKGIVQPPPTQRDKDLYLLESRFSGFMDASKARQFLENNMLKATKKEKDLLKKYYDASGRFIPREELPVQQQNSLNSFIR